MTHEEDRLNMSTESMNFKHDGTIGLSEDDSAIADGRAMRSKSGMGFEEEIVKRNF